jgi:hypothetical protein
MNVINRWLSNTPWWLLSAGIHTVLLLGAALVYIERAFSMDVSVVTLIPGSDRSARIDSIESPRETLGQAHESPAVTDSEPVDDPFFNPAAVLAKKNESADNDLRHELRGDDPEAVGWIPGEAPGFTGRGRGGPGWTEALGTGVGGGSSLRKGRPGTGGMVDTMTGPGTKTKQTESAVIAALRWLARHQDSDGHWSAQGFGRNCAKTACSGGGESDYDTGVTGLSLLAFLGAGYTSMSKDDKQMIDPAFPDRQLHFGDAVKRGLQWLVAQQDAEGCVGERGVKHLYNHAIAALALSEGYGMTGLEILRGPAQKSIDFLVAAQNPGKGWRYSARGGDNDTSVTGWAVMALKSAELSGLQVPAAAYAGALRWLEEATEKNGYYRVGYTQAGTGKVFVPGKNEQFSDHPSMSAVAVLSRIFIQKTQKEPALTAANLLAADLPAWKPGQVDFYYWYYASLALFQLDGPKGPFWSKWNEPMKAAIVPHQKTATHVCENGSWDPSEERWGFEGGRVYAAAINCLTLEVYYRYAHVFGTQH